MILIMAISWASFSTGKTANAAGGKGAFLNFHNLYITLYG